MRNCPAKALSLCAAFVLLLASIFGLMAFLSNLVPLAATAPILIYIAMTLISERGFSVLIARAGRGWRDP